MTSVGDAHRDNGPEDSDPGLARARTSLAWTRTAVSFAALGGVVLRGNVVTGLIILAVAPLVWQVGRIAGGGPPGAQPAAISGRRIRMITVSVVGVALLCLLVAVFGGATPGVLR